MATTFQRARSDEQRAIRRQTILDTAAAMLEEMPASELSLNELSRRVGLAKSNVLLTADPPLHKRQRGLVAMALTPRRVKEMEPEFHVIVDELIENLPD